MKRTTKPPTGLAATVASIAREMEDANNNVVPPSAPGRNVEATGMLGAMNDVTEAVRTAMGMHGGQLPVDSLGRVDLSHLLPADIDTTKLAGMTNVLESLSHVADLGIAANFTALPAYRLPEIVMPVPPTYDYSDLTDLVLAPPADVEALHSVQALLVEVRDELVRGRTQESVITDQQTTLLQNQSLALIALVNDAKGQKWNRRIMVGAAVTAAAIGLIGVLITILYYLGIVGPLTH
jgi:hypothetical protein